MTPTNPPNSMMTTVATPVLEPGTLERIRNALTYEVYLEHMAASLGQEDTGDRRIDAPRDYARLNYKRTQRIHRTYVVPERVRDLVARIEAPQTWMVLTEDWCGDSAQTIPYLVEMVLPNPHVDLRILPRDDYPRLMDAYETGGKRAVPIVAAFDEEGREFFRWGPRPAPAAALFQARLDEGVSKKEAYRELHLWYGRDRGKTFEAEIEAILRSLVAG